MKIRQGFVSNSSSSSFVAIAREIDINSVTKEMLNSNNIMTFGKWRSEGMDLIIVNDSDMLTFFKVFGSYDIQDGYGYNDAGTFTFYELSKFAYDGSFSFNKEELSDGKYVILNETVDYHCSESIYDLIELYTNGDLDKEKIKRIYREKKLNRIIKDEN